MDKYLTTLFVFAVILAVLFGLHSFKHTEFVTKAADVFLTVFNFIVKCSILVGFFFLLHGILHLSFISFSVGCTVLWFYIIFTFIVT